MDFICVGNGQVQYKFLLEQSYLKLFFTLSLTFSFTPPSSSCERRVGGFFFSLNMQYLQLWRYTL